MPDVFISYNREDQHRARGIADALESEGLDVWWDSNLKAGESYDEVTEKNLREAGAVVVLWSKQSAASKWVRAEATIGERCSTLVPAMIEECDRPLRFELVQTADLIRWHGDRADPQWQSFIHAIKRAIGHHEKEADPTPVSTSSAASGAAHDVTIENTFWTSIKDGTDRSDFEAYLKRYPDGHFADLARNRVTALDRAEQDARERAAAKASAVTPTPSTPSPAQRSVEPVQRQAAPQHSRPAPAPEKKTNVVLFGLIGLGALAAAVTAFLTLQNRDDGQSSENNVIAEAVDEKVNDTIATETENAANAVTAEAVEETSASEPPVVTEPPLTPANEALAENETSSAQTTEETAYAAETTEAAAEPAAEAETELLQTARPAQR